MRDEINIPVLKDEDIVAANMRRDKYSITRDIKAREFNEAIANRLLAESRNRIKCEKCGKEFETDISEKDLKLCPECK